jgi:hypothetical protein
MLVFRSFAIGLSAACFALLVMRPAVELRIMPAPTAVPAPPPAEPPQPTIIDAAAGITPAQLASTLRLGPGEQIVSIDDASVAGDVGAGIALASRALCARQFIDIGVAGPAGERRVLVLLH